MVTPTTITNTDNTDMTDTDLTTDSTEPTMRLEECDEAFIRGVLLIKDAVLNYARHGLTAKAIHDRVRALGATEGSSTIRRWVADFRAEKLLPEKELGVRRLQQIAKQERETKNARIERISPEPLPEPAPLVTCEDPEDITFAAQRIDTDALDRAAVEFVLRDYGRWDNQMGFFPDPPLTLIRKHLNQLTPDEVQILRKELNAYVTEPDDVEEPNLSVYNPELEVETELGEVKPSSLWGTLVEQHEVELPSKVVDLMDEDGFVMHEAVEALTTDEVVHIIEKLSDMANRERGNAVSYLATSELLLKRYGSCDKYGAWNAHPAGRVIKSLIPDLTDNQLKTVRTLINNEFKARKVQTDLPQDVIIDV
jgi:hypothetical protein